MPEYSLETHYLDVGQGDCSIIIVKDTSIQESSTGHDPQIVRTVVYDCGSQGGSLPGNRLFEKCNILRIPHIDVAIISHYDKDHFLGFLFLLNKKSNVTRVQELFSATKFYTIGDSSKRYTFEFEFGKKNIVSRYGPVKKKTKSLSIGNQLMSSLKFYDLFIKSLYIFSQKPNINLKHVTERVFSGFPDTDSVTIDPGGTYLIHKDEWKPTAGTESNDPNLPDYKVVTFLSGDTDTILGKDLLNLEFEQSKQIPDIHLYCLTYNKKVIVNFDPNQEGLEAVGVKNDKVANSKSIGCLLKFNEYTAWFGGDLPSTEEDKVIQSIKGQTSTMKDQSGKNIHHLTILKAGHHGADESTSNKLINNLNPLYTVITCGSATDKSRGLYDEHGQYGEYGHPGPETMQRLMTFYQRLYDDKSDPDYGIYVTWISRNRRYTDEDGRTFRGNDYLGINGTHYTNIVEGDIMVKTDGIETELDANNEPDFYLERKDTTDEVISAWNIEEYVNTKGANYAEANGIVPDRISYEVFLDEKKSFYARLVIVLEGKDKKTGLKRKHEDSITDLFVKNKKRKLNPPGK